MRRKSNSPAPPLSIPSRPKNPSLARIQPCSSKSPPRPETADPAALSLALGGASRAKADAYLDDQRHHLHEQLNQIHLDVWEKKLGVMLRLATLVVGLAAAAGVGLLVWDAAHANGLIVEPFNVPPDLAAKGMTGQVVAAKGPGRAGVAAVPDQFRPAGEILFQQLKRVRHQAGNSRDRHLAERTG